MPVSGQKSIGVLSWGAVENHSQILLPKAARPWPGIAGVCETGHGVDVILPGPTHCTYTGSSHGAVARKYTRIDTCGAPFYGQRGRQAG